MSLFRTALAGSLVLFSVPAARPLLHPAADISLPALSPPILVAPADDPARTKCLVPDAGEGVRLEWRAPAAEDGLPLASYIDVRRRALGSEEWRPWVRKYARPPFTLLARPQLYDSEFAWHVWTVDRSGQAKPYAVSSDWSRFCTRPREEMPAYGSSRPARRSAPPASGASVTCLRGCGKEAYKGSPAAGFLWRTSGVPPVLAAAEVPLAESKISKTLVIRNGTLIDGTGAAPYQAIPLPRAHS